MSLQSPLSLSEREELERLRHRVEQLEQGEERYRRSEEKFRKFVETTRDWVWEVDEHAVYTYASRRIRDILGYEPEEVIGKTPFDLMPPEEAARVAQIFGPIAAARQPFTLLENTNRHKDGRLVVLETSGTPIFDTSGTFRGYHGIDRDITRRKLDEGAIRRTTAHLEALIRESPLAVVELDEQGCIRRWNEAATRLFGWTEQEVLGRELPYVPPGREEEADRLWERAMSGDCPRNLELRRMRKDASCVDVALWATVLRNEEGLAIGSIGFFVDITDRKRAEEALQKQRLFLRQVIDINPNFVFAKDRQGCFTLVNQAVAEVYGTTVKELIGKTDADFNSNPEEVKFFREMDLRVMDNREELFIPEERITDAAGKVRWLQMVKRPLLNDRGEADHVLGVATDITLRKQAEEALRLSEERFRRMFEDAPLGMVLVGPDTKLLKANRRFCEMVGYDESEVVGNTYALYTHHDDLSRNLELTDQFFRGERQVYTLDKRYRCKNGEEKWVRVTTTGMIEPAGEARVLLAMVEDITERHLVQKALQESRERLALAIDAARLGFWDWDLHTQRVTWSPMVHRIFGLPDHGFSGRYADYLDFVHPNDRPIVTEAIAQALQGTGAYALEHRILWPDGSLHWLECKGEVVRGAGGQATRMVGTVMEITQRKRAEEERTKALRDLENVMETVPDLIYRLDMDVRLVGWNRKTETVTGFTSDELMLRPALEFIAGEDRARVAQAILRAFEEGYAEVEANLLRKDGRAIPYHWTGATLKDKQGRVIGLTGVGRDISERKRIEASLRESEERYRMLVDFLPCGVFVYCEGRTAYINHAGAKIMGATSPREITDRPTFEFVHPDYREEVLASAQRILSGGDAVRRAERIYLKLDGTPITVEVEAAPITWNGKPAIQGIFSDITERKRAEAALRESEERFAKAFRSSPYPMVISEIESGLCLDANDAAIHLFGHPREEVAGKTVEELRLWPTPEHRKEFIRRLKELGALRNVEVSLRMESGELRQCLVSAEQIELNRKPCLVTIGYDVTDQRRAERNLRFTQFAVDRAADMVFWIDRDARLLYVNDAACRQLGYTREELLRMTVADIDPDYQLAAWPAHWEDLRRQKRLRFETRHRTKEGEIYPAEVVANYVTFEGKEYDFAFTRDITQRRRAEEALRASDQELRRAFDERERISQDLHDGILQSLYAVGLQLDAAGRLLATSPRQAKRELHSAISHLNRTIEDVRGFITHLKLDPLQGRNFKQAIQTVVHAFQKFDENQCRVSISPAAVSRMTRQQSLHLLSIVREAVSNSVRHGRASEIHVALRRRRKAVRLEVRDNGIGFDPAAPPRRGFGLGNMKARSSKIGGRLNILSDRKVGTRVVLELPQELS
jgi:PAS domain S-box-containing protein